MSCCAPGAESFEPSAALPSTEEMELASRDLGDGSMESWLTVPGVHCGSCIKTAETAAMSVAGVEQARLNLSSRTLTFKWKKGECDPADVIRKLGAAGYNAFTTDPVAGGKDPVLRRLLISLAIAGFAASNIMLLSVSVWSGADGATRDMFHWISALIALPAIVFAGAPFFRPAWAALRQGSLNMDVPISLAVILAAAMSLYETINHGENAYFDASVSLLFFLLIGRTLDHVMREKARSAVRSLARMSPNGATVIAADGSREFLPISAIHPAMRLHVAAGERIPVDSQLLKGESDFDFAIVNGESVPVQSSTGMQLPAGVLNLSGPVEIASLATANDSFIAEMVRMISEAEGAKAGFRRIADRAAAIYAPAVHLLSLATFVGWMALGQGWHFAATTAIAVLVITCPCALGLAVPIVHVVAAGRLFRNGVMVRNGAALEKLATIDTALFDKTGTLTTGMPQPVGHENTPQPMINLAAALARESRHPFSRAIAQLARTSDLPAISAIQELPGKGVEAICNGSKIRLGRPDWATDNADTGDGIVLAVDSAEKARFMFSENLRKGACELVDEFARMGISSEILSGDSQARVGEIAAELGIENQSARLTPADKLQRLAALSAAGKHTLMVGDGVNDAPALAAADVSFAPSSAADIGRSSADFVFLHDDLRVIGEALSVARRAKSLVLQNFGIAIAYNLIAVPLAVAGLATPLVAALAMSSSSILVVGNAMRLNFGGRRARMESSAPAMPTRTDRIAVLPERLAA
ncbi:MAG: cadmium-translocating P-type ATPase [Nitratireductor sp.]|nr:cadmium-translocating P-type ATPase [Nitratireductor sp.]